MGVVDAMPHLSYSYYVILKPYLHGPLTNYAKLRVAHAPGMPGTFSPPPRVSSPDMHHGSCVTHVPWCMPGSLTSDFLCSRWHSWRMRNPQFYVSGNRPMLCDAIKSYSENHFSTLRPQQNGREFSDSIFLKYCSDLINISLKFVLKALFGNDTALVYTMALHPTGNEPLIVTMIS